MSVLLWRQFALKAMNSIHKLYFRLKFMFIIISVIFIFLFLGFSIPDLRFYHTFILPMSQL